MIPMYRLVQQYWSANNINAELAFGMRARTVTPRSSMTGRVVFQPADDSGKMGKLAAPRMRPMGARAVSDREALMLVDVWAWDSEKPQDELAQFEAVESLFEVVQRAVHFAATGNYAWGGLSLTPTVKELVRGVEYRAELLYRYPYLHYPDQIGTGVPQTTREIV